jgi:hypothetical protein
MTMQVQIYSVLVFRNLPNGTRDCVSHYLAGTSSQDALDRIEKRDRDHFDGDAFITTDEHCERHQRTAQFYTNTMRKDENLDADTIARWIKSSTNPTYDCGERYPAAFRRVSFR